MSAKAFDIVISGASFAGLALARSLRLALGKDLAIALVDRAAGPPSGQDSRAFAIWAGSKNVLDALGVWTALSSAAQPMTSIEISDTALDDGLRSALLTYDATTADGAAAGYIVPSSELHRVLFSSLDGDANVTWIAPAEAEGLAVDAAGITTRLADGQTLRSALLVAAEGRRSRLRDAAGIKTTGWGYGQRGIVAIVGFSEDHHGVAIQHFLPGGPFAVLPMTGQRACITWSSAHDEAARVLALDEAGFLAELDKRISGRFGDITLLSKPQSWPLDVKIARSFRAPRFALIGDAAHGVHPVAGQGVNLAFRDVAALTECLADAARLGFDLGHAEALERYERWRRFDTTMSAAAYDGLNRLFSVDNMLVRAVRGAGLGALDRVGALKSMIVKEAAGLTGDTPKMVRGELV
ncbi:MAG TPA: FAD-dependent monooxygenase [Hyphomicrobium sp.]|nr:FAD-dependent monooxygenase [Hyphomicrobium sp.]